MPAFFNISLIANFHKLRVMEEQYLCEKIRYQSIFLPNLNCFFAWSDRFFTRFQLSIFSNTQTTWFFIHLQIQNNLFWHKTNTFFQLWIHWDLFLHQFWFELIHYLFINLFFFCLIYFYVKVTPYFFFTPNTIQSYLVSSSILQSHIFYRLRS